MSKEEVIVISDLHLGSDVCQVRLLEAFLKDINHENIKTNELILNGDVFDSWDFRRLKKHHWNVLSQIRKLSDHVRVTWVGGNHDGPTELISHLLGVDVIDEYVIESGGKRICFHHGHRYDKFITEHPVLTWVGDQIYWFLQKIDPSFGLAKSAKHTSKTFLRNSQRIESKSLEYAEKNDFDSIVCGHTHFAVAKPGKIGYYNSGCWTELPCHFLSVKNGIIELHQYN